MTSTGELSTWCKRHGVSNFIGVFCSNDVPYIKTKPGNNVCFIVNHSPCNSVTGGTHWLACRIEGTHANWFDSFGFPPTSQLENNNMSPPGEAPPQFDLMLKKFGVKTFSYNTLDLQSITSDVCGLYAAYFCKHGLPLRKVGVYKLGGDIPYDVTYHLKLLSSPWSFVTGNVKKNDDAIKRLVRI
jgi:hypothetical protein